MNDLSEITKGVTEIESALKGMNFGRALKLSEDLREELEGMHLEFFYYPEAAIRNYERAVEADLRKEIGQEFAEKFDRGVGAKVIEDVQQCRATD